MHRQRQPSSDQAADVRPVAWRFITLLRGTLIERKGIEMFEAQKSAQLAGVLLSHAPAHSMDKIKFIKLTYLVDRESFLKVGATVTGDRMVSLSNGPILSASLNSLNGNSEYTAEFKKWIVIPREGHLFSLAAGKDRKDADLLRGFGIVSEK